LRIVAEYSVGLARVRIVENGQGCRYVVEEPPLPPDALEAYTALLEWFQMHGGDPTSDADYWRAAEILGVVEAADKYKAALQYYLRRELLGYGKLQVFIEDPGIEEVGVGPGSGPVWVVLRFVCGGWIPSSVEVGEGEVDVLAQRLARAGGKSLSIAFPAQEFTIPEGHRVTVIYGREISVATSITIRKFPDLPLTMDKLVGFGSLMPEAAAFLEHAVLQRRMIMVVGPQGSGKTTLVSALLDLVPETARVVTVEEVPEIRLRRRNWVPLYTREPQILSPEAERARIGIEELLRRALRLRADYVAVAEARGREIRYLFEAAALGAGSLGTFHAGSLEELEARLELLGVPRELRPLLRVVVVMAREGARRYVDKIYVDGSLVYERGRLLDPSVVAGLEERVQWYRRVSPYPASTTGA